MTTVFWILAVLFAFVLGFGLGISDTKWAMDEEEKDDDNEA